MTLTSKFQENGSFSILFVFFLDPKSRSTLGTPPLPLDARPLSTSRGNNTQYVTKKQYEKNLQLTRIYLTS